MVIGDGPKRGAQFLLPIGEGQDEAILLIDPL
jgi:hypothetical protein